jgi:hypothetical protein
MSPDWTDAWQYDQQTVHILPPIHQMKTAICPLSSGKWDMAVEVVKADVMEAVMTTYEQTKQEGRQRFSSALCPLSSVFRHLSSALCPLSSVIRPLFFVFRHPSSVICFLFSVICHPSSVLCRPSSASITH